MAEDLKRRLHFGDDGLCLGAAAKLFSQVVKQKEKLAENKPINSHSSQILELKILWDQCTVESCSVCVACSETLVSLVRDGHADMSYVMKGFLNVIPSAVNVSGALQALRQLLLLDMHACTASEGVYRCRYGLRNPPHPFISALTSRPDCWPVVLQQVSKLLSIKDDRYCGHTVSMLRPFLAYVLLNPTMPQQLTTFKMLLVEVLLQVDLSTSTTAGTGQPCGKHTLARDISDFFLDCLHQVKITSLHELSEVISYLVKFANFTQVHVSINRTVHKSLALTALTLCKNCVTFGHDVTPCLSVLGMMIESCGVDWMDETVICILSWLMLEVPRDQLRALLSVTHQVVSACECNMKMLILPLLRIISTPVYTEVILEKQERSRNQRQASQLLSFVCGLVQQGSRKRTQITQKDKRFSEPLLNSWFQLMQSCCRILHTLTNDADAAYVWLVNLQSNVASAESVSAPVMLLVSSLFWAKAQKVVRASLDVLISIASQDFVWAPTLLPLLLYRLNQECDPLMTLDLLCAIPQTATHKVCVTAVMKALQSLAIGNEALGPLVLRLTTQLWKLQDRSFPHLQKLLSQTLPGIPDCGDRSYELLLAKVASIRDVCALRPHHGADLLPMLSKLLNDCTSDREASIASLALDALYSLCQAEVVDLRTMWAVLEPKLTNDKRPLVMQSLCKLLGSAPGLLAETQDYEDFCDSIVELLWLYSNHGNPMVSAAAFTALANFNGDDFTLDDLPPEVSQEEIAKIEAAKAKQREAGDGADKQSGKAEEEEEEEEALPIPPSCYMKLLMHVHQDVLPAYQVLLSSLLIEEVKNLPRGIHKYASHRQQETVSRSKTFDSIPSLLLNRFERTKQPGLKPGLAVGLLCCFEPKREMSRRDHKPAVRHVIHTGRAYQQQINTLMNEVCVDSNNWFECLQLPHAWTSLMKNALPALIQSRCAELELQRSHGHLDESQADFQMKINTAWLWVRDKLTDQLKTAAKSNFLAQSNSVLALASLAVVSTHYFLSLDDDSETEAHYQSSLQHIGQRHWLGVVIDTLLSLLGKHQTKAKIFTWYQQHCGESGGTFSAAVQSNAALGISLLAPFLLTTNTQLLHSIIDALIHGLPGQPKAHLSHGVQAHHGLALGMLTARLYEEHYTDYTGTEGEVTMIRVVDALEAASLNNKDSPASYGSLLGLSIALSAMSTQAAGHIKAHVANMHSKLVARLDIEEKDTLYMEALCMCIGCLTAASFHSNIISSDIALSVAVKLQTLCQQYDQNTGVAVSTAVMLHGLVSNSHPSANPLLANLFSTWSSVIASQMTSVSQKIAAMYGLAGLVTGPGLLMQSSTQTQITADMHNKRMAVAKQINQTLSDWSDPAIQNAAAFLLGYLRLVSTSAFESKTGIPSSYSYLPETSILRACIDQLVLAGKAGPETIPPRRLEAILSLLAGKQGIMPPLPPLNWTVVLSPILRLPYGEKIHSLCLEVALSQCQRPSASTLCVIVWLSPAIFTTFKESCKTVLYGSLPALIRAVPASKLKPFVETKLLEPFHVFGAHTLHQCEVIVDGLLAALRISDPPQGVVIILHKAVRDIYGLIPASLQIAHGRIMAKLAQCLWYLPGEDIDAVTSPLEENNLLKSTFVRSYVVCQGKQSLMWLNPCVDVAMNVADTAQHRSLVWMLLAALTQCDSIPSQHTACMPRLHWLLELMGHASNVAHAKTKLAPKRPIHKAVDILLDVFAVAVIAWSSTDLRLILGIAPSWLSTGNNHDRVPGKTSSTARTSSSFAGFQQTEQDAIHVMHLLSYSLPLLLNKEPWSQITEKVLNWLLDLNDVEHEVMSSKTRAHLKAAVLNLRHTPAFKKPACWTRVHNP